MTAPREWRDLAWLLQSPPLLQGDLLLNSELTSEKIRQQEPDFSNEPVVQAWLRALHTEPAPLLQFIAAQRSPGKPLRLGRYAERLLEFYLRHGPTHRLLAANLPLRRAAQDPPGDTTIGEIDFLLQDSAGVPWHWELAVKYFLCHASGPVAAPPDFVGPDGAETLDSKLRKLQRQLRHTPPAPWSDTPWRHAAFSRGWMFYRHGHAVPHCAALHPQHLRGGWLPVSELASLPHERLALLGRAHWMAQLESAQDPVLCLGSARDIAAHLDALWAQPTPAHYKKPGAQMLVGLELRAGQWREAARYFICPENQGL